MSSPQETNLVGETSSQRTIWEGNHCEEVIQGQRGGMRYITRTVIMYIGTGV